MDVCRDEANLTMQHPRILFLLNVPQFHTARVLPLYVFVFELVGLIKSVAALYYISCILKGLKRSSNKDFTKRRRRRKPRLLHPIEAHINNDLNQRLATACLQRWK